MNKLNTNTNLLKLIGIITMLVDHIGIVFFNNNIIFRIIGRLSFPLFFYSTFIGFFKTKDLKKYIIRLLILALISEPIYYLLFNEIKLNICFTLIIELLFLYFLNNKKYINYLLLIIIMIPLIPYMSYSLFVILLTPLFYYTKNTKVSFSISFILSYIILVLLGFEKIYLYSIFSLPLILIPINMNIKINKYFYYLFYPCHLLVLLFINYFF